MYFFNKKKINWHERYLPFVSRSPEMQIKWLINAFKKGILTNEELIPYVRILLDKDDIEKEIQLKEIFKKLDKETLTMLLLTADIYDTAQLFRLLPTADAQQAEIALKKYLPAYEKKPQKILDDIFYAVNDRPGHLLQKAAESLMTSGKAPPYFQKNYKRFLEILHDEEFLLSIYPNAQR
jgi:hypothetical protein